MIAALELRDRIAHELTSNILPFWLAHTRDEVNGGFYGALTNDLQIDNAAPRSAVTATSAIVRWRSGRTII